MARKKTKKEKVKTSLRRAEEGVRLTQMRFDESILEEVGTSKTEVGQNKVKGQIKVTKATDLFEFDPVLLRKDLRKTMLLTFLVFALEMGLYVVLR